MSKKIFRSIIAVAMVVLLASLFISSTFLYDYFNKSQVSQLKEELSLVAAYVDEAGTEYFDNFDSNEKSERQERHLPKRQPLYIR